MDTLFICKFKHTKENNLEMNKAYSGAKQTIIKTVFLAIFVVLAHAWYFNLGSLLGCIAYLIIGISGFLWVTFRNHLFARKNEKRLLLLYNEIPESATYFYDDYLLTTNEKTNGELKLDYDKIIKVKQSQNLYLLILKERLVVMVDKNRFEKGTCEEFEEFIKSKAVNAKIKL